MNNAVINFPLPANEPVKAYMPGSPERVALEAELERQSNLVVDIPIIIGGKEIRTGDTGTVTCPHDHKHVLATYHKVTKKEIKMAIDAAMKAWNGTPMAARVASFVRCRTIRRSCRIFCNSLPTVANPCRIACRSFSA